MALTAFVSAAASPHNGMNFLGVSPGPKSLAAFQFFHQYGAAFGTSDTLKTIMLDVKMQDGYDES